MVFIGATSGLDVQSQNFWIEGRKVRDRMDSPELYIKSIFRSGGGGGGGEERTTCLALRHDLASECDRGA